ncbi:MAG: DNA repair protein RecO [Pseudomonadota bacterium]
MQWEDEGIVLSVRPHGETVAICELFTRSHGRHLGLVHGGRSRKMRPILQPGNHVDAVWKARLSEHLGSLSVELQRGYAATAMADALALNGLQSLTQLLNLMPERDPFPNLYEVTLFVLGFLDDDDVWPALLVRWELAILDELGFGLDLSCCASTGQTHNLRYVSPKSGRAVSLDAGEPYKDRLLRLPSFLDPGRARGGQTQVEDVIAGLELTGHFLQTRVLQPEEKVLPDARQRLLDGLQRRMDEQPGNVVHL